MYVLNGGRRPKCFNIVLLILFLPTFLYFLLPLTPTPFPLTPSPPLVSMVQNQTVDHIKQMRP